MAIRCGSPIAALPVEKYPSPSELPKNALPKGSSGNHAAVMICPEKTPRNASTTDHASQYPKVEMGPMSVKCLRQPSCA